MRKSLRLLPAAVSAVVAVTVLGACAPSSLEDRSASALADLFAGYSADYDPVASPAELAKASDLVVAGKIVRIVDGPQYGTSADDPGLSSSVVLQVHVDKIYAGSLPSQAREMVYVVLPAPGGTPASSYDKHVSKASTAVFYLEAAATAEQTPMLGGDSGRPKKQPLLTPPSPQGIVIEDDGDVVQLLEKTTFEGTDLSAFIPESEKFPVDPGAPQEPDVDPS
ncbi:hypothetical protein [Cellulomonas fengjieae]|uniref:hypothetical protein n=1 Tax=Cellulomonas fengjieae TaxID=2819978 RepID=UPI001AAFD045|nr:hypothetical protein [Cellulomonas fengjieae]MBO3102797.1 hypothetical protein [Cellulomonas fengjieae]